jgi:hypothetical protein
MQTLEVTDEQYAFIQRLREEISESVVGKYGFVRERDAVQFLIDNLDDDVEVDGEFDSSATDDVAASVGAAIDGADEPHELETVSYVEEPTDADGELEEADDEDVGSSVTEPTDADADEPAADEAADDGSEGDSDEGDDAEGGSDDEPESDDGSADDEDMLDEMMRLLETHDDKWTEADSADYRYTVDLPDGSTEQVQTKDDVRALLFKNYR